jgi:TetR/AcrR family transcriptional regulator, transcriptional repressor for nem operon
MQFDPENALETAMVLFWRKGYEATSLQDLLKATGLSKSSLYQTFGNKHSLFESSLERYRRDIVAEMRLMLDSANSGRVFIERIFTDVADETKGKYARRGCLVMNTASEFAQSDPAIARLVKQATKAFTDVFEAAVIRAQKEGDISTRIESRTLAKYLVSSMSGLKTMVKAGATPAEINAISRMVLKTAF